MKKVLVSLLLSAVLTPLWSQTYRMEPVYTEGEWFALSHWVPEDETSRTEEPVFALWGYQRYDESSSTAYEVEYFRGGATEMYRFLEQVAGFAEKYSRKPGMLAFISGVKVRSFGGSRASYTAVYDREGKVPCYYKASGWRTILNSYVDYCRSHGIDFDE